MKIEKQRGALRHGAIERAMFQREIFIIISVITHRPLFIGVLRDNNTSLRQTHGRAIITQIDRSAENAARGQFSRAPPPTGEFKFLI